MRPRVEQAPEHGGEEDVPRGEGADRDVLVLHDGGCTRARDVDELVEQDTDGGFRHHDLHQRVGIPPLPEPEGEPDGEHDAPGGPALREHTEPGRVAEPDEVLEPNDGAGLKQEIDLRNAHDRILP